MDKIKKILSNYTPENYAIFHDTFNELCSRGIGNGVYQDMTVLVDIIEIIAACEQIIKKGEKYDN